MPARHSLAPLLRLEEREGSLLRTALSRLGGEVAPPATFDGGLQRLPLAIAERHADRVHLDAPVTAVAERDDGYVLRTGAGRAGVDHVVVTAPAPAAADLLADLVPDATGRLRDLEYNPLAVVHLRSTADASGFGYLVARDEGLHTLGVTWNASLFGRDGVYAAFLGGMTDPEVLDRDDDFLGELAAEEFARVMGTGADAISVTRLRRGIPAYDGSWEALEGLRLPPGVRLATNYTARMGIPSRVREAEALAESLAAGG